MKFKSIRSLILKQDNLNEIKFSYSFGELNYSIIDLEANKRLSSSAVLTLLSTPKQLYTNKLPINPEKYKDLKNFVQKMLFPSATSRILKSTI